MGDSAFRDSSDLYRAILECLAGPERAALATVLSRSGSGPREPGAAMIVRADGRISGTVGGGPLEAGVQAEAAKAIADGRARCLPFSLTNREAAENGMICGGTMEVLVEVLDAADPLLEGIARRILLAREEGRRLWVARSIRPDDGGESVRVGLGLLDETGLDASSLDSPCRSEEFLRPLCGREPLLASCSGGRCFVQPAGLPERVFLFGAGHVAQALAVLCDMTGFRTVVVDDRPEFACADRFPRSRIVVPDSFGDCLGSLDIGPCDFLVIVTRGHAFDKVVLAQALETPARYVGMIASRRKRDVIYRSLAEEGTPPEKLARVSSPIGLAIGAQTPAEIAVSIAAELIAVRAGCNRREGERK